ncbi:MAG: hypothetical protein NTY71_04085 [Methanoregula sp.]|nr:hypothetical protein [Methanoregula sp.]
MTQNIIIKQGARILTPDEYEALRSHLNPKHRLIFDAMLFSGMRGAEFWRFFQHPEWFNEKRGYIHLPKSAVLKKKAGQREREIMLSNIGSRSIRDFVGAVRNKEIKYISRFAWFFDLKRAARKAGIGDEGITPKLTRKTWVSWLMACFPDDGLRISSSLGHSVDILQKHYLSVVFSDQEKQKIRMYVSGWNGRNT